MSKKADAERRDLEPVREDDDAPEASDDDSGDDCDDFDPLQQITQLLVTEDGTPLVDVLVGIREAMDKLVKVQTKALALRSARQ